MYINDQYLKIYDKIIPEEICQELIELFDESAHKEIIDNDIMSFEQLNISTHEEYRDTSKKIVQIMYELFELYKTQCNLLDIQVPKNLGYEGIRIKKYYDTKCEFKPHVDAIDGLSSKRYLSFLIYLNDTDGGKTVFVQDFESGIEIAPETGKVVIFPPTWNYPHFAEPVNSGVKYIISSYLCFI